MFILYYTLFYDIVVILSYRQHQDERETAFQSSACLAPTKELTIKLTLYLISW